VATLRTSPCSTTRATSSPSDAADHPLDLCLVGRREPRRCELGQHRQHDAALRAQLLQVVAPLLPEVIRGDRERGERDQADGQQVELGQQPGAHRRQVERRHRVCRKRRQVLP